MAGDRVLVRTVREQLHQAADPQRAPRMQAYLKSAMPCLGVRVPQVRAIVRATARARPPSGTTQLAQTASLLWRAAAYREERYAATALTGTPAARKLQTIALLPLYREMIITGAWWDHVDEVSHRVGGLLVTAPDELAPIMCEWAHEPDRWLRRCSVICQVGHKHATDTRLLSHAIEANLDDRDFFLRKAIGWALRDYARTDPDWVRGFLAEHSARLSPLSRREARKHLG
jgi:3-methyladenine DNA glycosylase AlkD